MNKKEFVRYINAELKPLKLERQIKILEKMQVWVTELLHSKQGKLGLWVEPSQRDKYVFCNECKTYYPKEKHKSIYEKEIRQVTVYSDCGYGDDDILGEVEESVEYKICPRCGQKSEISRYRLRIIRQWPRR